jgi:hypothetical protein
MPLRLRAQGHFSKENLQKENLQKENIQKKISKRKRRLIHVCFKR